MSLLDRMFFKNYTLVDWDKDISRLFGGNPVHSGVKVNEDTALRFITIYTCVRILAETIGSLPLQVYRKRPGGMREEATDHPLYEILYAKPNPDMQSQPWREAVMGHVTLSGNGYNLITWSGRGRVMDLQPWDWHHIRPARNKDTGRLEYEVWDRGQSETYPADRVLHIAGLGADGIQGYSPISMAREAVGLGLAASEFAARFYGSGMNVGGVIETPGELTPDARKDLKAFLEEEGAGLANSWRPLLLEFGMKFSRIPMLLRDAQFIEQQQFTEAQIAALFGVPSYRLNRHDGQPRANVEQDALGFEKYTLLPWATRWEQTINVKLFSPAERRAGYYVKFNLSALLRGDFKSRQEGLHIMRQDGVINADQWLALEDMDPQPDGLGQRLLINGAMTPVDAAGISQPKDRKHWTVNEMRDADGLPPVPDGNVPLDEWLRRKAGGGEQD